MTQTPTENIRMFVRMRNILGFLHSRQYQVSNTPFPEIIDSFQNNMISKYK